MRTGCPKLILVGEMELGRLQKGDEILVPANTYYATILAITSVGLKPVLIDARLDTLQIDERLIEQHITPQTKALLTVHLYGKLSVTPLMQELCRKHHLLLFEDNAQAFACQMLGEKTKSTGKAFIRAISVMQPLTASIRARTWAHWAMQEPSPPTTGSWQRSSLPSATMAG